MKTTLLLIALFGTALVLAQPPSASERATLRAIGLGGPGGAGGLGGASPLAMARAREASPFGNAAIGGGLGGVGGLGGFGASPLGGFGASQISGLGGSGQFTPTNTGFNPYASSPILGNVGGIGGLGGFGSPATTTPFGSAPITAPSPFGAAPYNPYQPSPQVIQQAMAQPFPFGNTANMPAFNMPSTQPILGAGAQVPGMPNLPIGGGNFPLPGGAPLPITQQQQATPQFFGGFPNVGLPQAPQGLPQFPAPPQPNA